MLCPHTLQVGVFRLDSHEGTLQHVATGLKVQPPGIDLKNAGSWTLENNYSEKAARLKSTELGNTYSIVTLFKHSHCPLPKAVKEPIAGSSKEGGQPSQPPNVCKR